MAVSVAAAAAATTTIVATDDCDSRPGQELVVAWNTVSTGLVPPAALGLVRPGKGWRACAELPRLCPLGNPSLGPHSSRALPVVGLPPSSAI